jgi:hypothetical protein
MGSATATVVNPTITTNITDNDTATWSISGSSSVTEGLAASYTVHLAGTVQPGQTATINLVLTDITTTSADHADFVTAVNNAVAAYNANPATSGTLSYVGGVLTFTSDGTGTTPGTMSDLVISLGAVNDGLAEGPEQYSVGLSNPGSTTGANVIGSGSVTTTIIQPDIAPIVDLNGPGEGNNNTVSYPGGNTTIQIAPNATITDFDSANLVSMIVTITNPQDNSSGGSGAGVNIKEILSLNSTAAALAADNGLTVSFTSDIANLTDPVALTITGSASLAVYQAILEGVVYSDTKGGNHSTIDRIVTVVVNDGTLNSTTQTVTVHVPSMPVGVAGDPINLALNDPSADHVGPVTLTIAGIPTGWSLSEGTDNGDGTWTVQTSDVATLSITSPVNYTGALLLNVTESWTNADGSAGRAVVSDNVEVFAKGAPIFAWSGDDTLTGAGAKDLFVFAQPIGNDTIYNFNASEDQIDLVGFAGFASFDDLQSHLAADVTGNAAITLADGQSITLVGVAADTLTAGNFVFNQTPVTNNAGMMIVGDGALLPLSGVIDNTATIALDSSGSTTVLQLIQNGITLDGDGQFILSDSDQNFISAAFPGVTLTNVNNTISGAGQIGDWQMTLINQGTIVATGTHALTIDTGLNAVINSGVMEATGPGGLIVTSDVSNSGLIWADGGTISINGTVTGTGDALISGGTLEFFSASSIDVKFTDGTLDTLVLDNPTAFTGQIFGFSGKDLDLIDLKGTAFDAGTSWTYYDNDGSDTGGTLTIYDNTDGTTTELDSIKFANGDYATASFVLTSDGNGGTLIADATTSRSGTGIDAGNGGNTLVGTAGSDTFVFNAIADSQPGVGNFDTIKNFTHNSDYIDLTAITGANTIQGPVDAATSVAAHSISWFVDGATNQTIVYVNTTDRANHVDMEIHLTGSNINLSGSDILHHT